MNDPKYPPGYVPLTMHEIEAGRLLRRTPTGPVTAPPRAPPVHKTPNFDPNRPRRATRFKPRTKTGTDV